MLNTNYSQEMASAHQFIIEHNDDMELRTFIRGMQDRREMMHGDRWSIIYDWMKEHYPEATGTLITGLTYYTEG